MLNQHTQETANIMQTNKTIELHAQPYDISKTGFYFSSFEEFEEKAELSGAEEFEIQFIDGEDCDLFGACHIDQSNLETWFSEIQDLDSWDKLGLYYLMECRGYYLEDALLKTDEPSIQEGELLDCATDLFDDIYSHDIPENIRFYIDYQAFARDCEIGGDLEEFEFNGITYTCTNANCL